MTEEEAQVPEQSDLGATEQRPPSVENTIQRMLSGDRGQRGEIPPIKSKLLREFLESIQATVPPVPSELYWNVQLTDLTRMLRKGQFPPDEIRRVSGLLKHQLASAAAAGQMGNILRGREDLFSPEASRYETTYADFVRAELTKQLIQLNVDQWPPSWFKKDRFGKEDVADWQQLIRARIRLANAANVKIHIADTKEEEALQNAGSTLLTERELKLIYEMPGVREALETYIETLFDRCWEDYEDDEGGETKIRNIFFWQLRLERKRTRGGRETVTNNTDKEVIKKLNSFEDFQRTLAREFKDRKIVDNEIDAQAAIAVAWNFLLIGNVVESADLEREVNPSGAYGEQIRAFMHPMVKAERKYKIRPGEEEEVLPIGTEEGWGKRLGTWIASVIDYAGYEGKEFDQFRQFRLDLNNKEIRPFPERICASLPELTTVATVDEKTGRTVKMSMAQALTDKKKIKFGTSDSNIMGSYGDALDSALRCYLIAVGKLPLEFGKNLEEWASTLIDARNKLRGKNVGGGSKAYYPLRPFYDDPEFYLWAIANSLGLHPNTTEILLNFPVSDDAYDVAARQIVYFPRLIRDEKDRKWIMQRIHAISPGGVFAAKKERYDIRRRAAIIASKISGAPKIPRVSQRRSNRSDSED